MSLKFWICLILLLKTIISIEKLMSEINLKKSKFFKTQKRKIERKYTFTSAKIQMSSTNAATKSPSGIGLSGSCGMAPT